ncbi:hypothetical protein [Hyphomonas sp.]|uniref:hypothetical protein n=1 Tax=Hyphomonas sp. TaxID=87 RepID=UPI00391DBD38
MLAKPTCVAISALVLTLAACGRAPEAVSPAEEPAAADVQVNEGEPIDGDVTLSVPETAVAGSYITPVFTGPANQQDYIDIVPRGFTATSGELAYIYVPAALQGNGLRVVTAPGEYDVRYIAELTTGREVKAVQPLTVTAAEVSLDAPETASAGEPITVAWTGPDGNGDYLDIVPAGFTATSGEINYAYTSAGSPARLTAPGAEGDYLIRYILEGPGGRAVLVSAPLLVTPVTATLTAPDSAAAGETIIVTYEGPQREGDYIDLVRSGFLPASGELAYFYAGAQFPNQLTLPAEAGEYEIRYVLEAPGGRRVLARRPIRVE